MSWNHEKTENILSVGDRQVAEDGTMSLSLSEEPDWQAKRLKYNNGLPLTYRDRTISQTQASVN